MVKIISGFMERINEFLQNFFPERAQVLGLKSILKDPINSLIPQFIVYFQPRVHGEVILDIACGNGWFSGILHKHGFFILSIDISHEAIYNAKRNFPGPNYIIASALKIPLKNSSISTVVSLETIEHLNNGIIFLKEVYRILKIGGRLLLSTPNGGSLYHRIYEASTGKKCIVCKYHFYEYNEWELTNILKNLNFKIEEKNIISFAYPVLIPPIAILCLILLRLTSSTYWFLKVKNKSLMGTTLLFTVRKMI